VFHSEDGSSMDLRNAGILPQHYMASQLRTQLEISSAWKPQISKIFLIFSAFSSIPFSSLASNRASVLRTSFFSSSLALQSSLGYGLLHKIQLNFLKASQQFSFLQGMVVSPTPNPHPGGPGLCIYIPQKLGGYPFESPLTTGMGYGGTILIPWSPQGDLF
jgi:hypothetical protein